MAVVEELIVKLDADTKGYIRDIAKASKATEKSTDKIEKEFNSLEKKAKKSSRGVSTAIGTMAGVIGGNLVLGAFSKLQQGAGRLFQTLIVDGVKAAQAQEDAINDLNSALERTGKFTPAASAELQAYASQLQSVSKFGDETILSTAGLIQSLGNLEKEGLKKATTAAVDMAAALKIDLKAAAVLVGKAATGEVSSFTRYGLAIKKGKDETETFANALDAINAKFGGAAAQQITTYSGAVQQLSNTWGDVTEEIGFAITQNPNVLKAIKDTEKALLGSQETVGQFSTFIVDALLGVEDPAIKMLDRVEAAKKKLIELEGIANRAAGGGGIIGRFFGEKTAEDVEEQKELLAGLEAELDAIVTANVERDRAKIASDNEAKGSRIENIEELLETEQTFLTELLDFKVAQGELTKELIDAQHAEELEKLNALQLAKRGKEDEHNKALLNLQKKFDEKRAIQEKKSAAAMKSLKQAEMLANVNIARASANLITAIAGKESKVAFAIAQGAAIAGSIVATKLATVRALAAPPGPPFTAPLAASVALAGNINTAAIAATTVQGFADGTASVPGFGVRDTVPALLTPKERVLKPNENKDFTDFIARDKEAQRVGGSRTTEVHLTMAPGVMDFIEAQLIERGNLNTSAVG